MNTKKYKVKKYEELTFTDDFMFCKVLMNNLDLCKTLLELILNIRIKKVVDVTKQAVIDITADAKSVRLDVYVEDDEATVYDVEMQTTLHRDLPNRSRYYQGMIDLNLMEKGAKYSELKKSYIIFICKKDPFDRNLPVYTFENICREAKDLQLNDGAVKVFVNASGDTEGMLDEARYLFRYLREGYVKENSFAARIEDDVRKARKHLEWRTEYMTLQMHYDEIADEAREEGLAEGRAKGRAEGRAGVIREMVQNGMPISLVAQYSKMSEDEVRRLVEEESES